VLLTRGNVGDWGQSVFLFGGDDEVGTCLCTDMAVLTHYFRIIKIILHPFHELRTGILVNWTCNGSLQVSINSRWHCCNYNILRSVLDLARGLLSIASFKSHPAKTINAVRAWEAAMRKLNYTKGWFTCHILSWSEVLPTLAETEAHLG